MYELHERASVLFYVALTPLFFLPQVEAKKGMQVEAGGGSRREDSEDQQENALFLGRKCGCLFERNMTAKQ